jgi:hypothetical protein
LGNILVINQDGVRDEKIKTWDGGIRLYDISDPAKPRETAFFKTDVAPRRGVHGFWLHEDPKQENSHSLRPPRKVTTTTF